MLRSICLSVCLSVPCPLVNNGALYGFCYYRTLMENPMLEVEPTGQRGQNGNEAIAGAASETFARWLHHRQRPVYTAHAPYDPRRTAIGGRGKSFRRVIVTV